MQKSAYFCGKIKWWNKQQQNIKIDSHIFWYVCDQIIKRMYKFTSCIWNSKLNIWFPGEMLFNNTDLKEVIKKKQRINFKGGQMLLWWAEKLHTKDVHLLLPGACEYVTSHVKDKL